jgi:hypothetical protein
VAIGGAYVDLVNGIGKSRMDLAKETVSFAADMAFVGQRFGMTDEESVKLATRMGVLSRSGFEPTRVAFVKLSSDSIHLGIGMDSLVGTFGILAEASTYAGHQAEYNVAQLEQLADTLMSLSKNGVPGFQNMTSQAVDAMIRKSAEFLSKVDDMKIAAITTRPGEGFGQMLERVAHMGASDRAGSVKQLATKTGMSLDINDTKSAFAIAKMMGFSGNLQDTLRMGRFLQEGATKGHLSEDMIKKRMASDIDDRLSKSKSVGEAVAAGADINQLIASTLQSILRILVSWSSSLMFRGTLSTETRNMAERASGMGGKGASPALGYGYRIPQLGRKN